MVQYSAERSMSIGSFASARFLLRQQYSGDTQPVFHWNRCVANKLPSEIGIAWAKEIEFGLADCICETASSADQVSLPVPTVQTLYPKKYLAACVILR